MSDSNFEPGLYVKGDTVRQAHSPSQAVALVAQGFAPKADEEPEATAPAPSVSDTAPVPDVPTPGSLFGSRDESQEDE